MLAERVRRIVGLTGKEILDEGLDFGEVELEEGKVTAELLIAPSACEDCIVSDEIIGQILLTQIQKKFPVVHSVEVIRKVLSEDTVGQAPGAREPDGSP